MTAVYKMILLFSIKIVYKYDLIWLRIKMHAQNNLL